MSDEDTPRSERTADAKESPTHADLASNSNGADERGPPIESPPADASDPGGIASIVGDSARGTADHALPFHVVGVGASAGGLEALQAFFERLSPVGSVCFVVVQHLSPDFKSMMAELLGRRTKLQVEEIRDGMAPCPGRLYLFGPAQVLTLERGRFRLEKRAGDGLFLPINLFFNSLAAHQGDQCAAVILSGTGTDGTHGARQVKEAGGLVAVQEPTSAKFDGMPNSVIASGVADVVATPRQLAEKLQAYVDHPLLPPPGVDMAVRDEARALPDILGLLSPRARLNLVQYKKGTVLRRLTRRASLVGDESLEAYLTRLRADDQEADRMARELLIGVTQFFRDPDAWSYLEQEVIPRLVESSEERGTLRLWVAGCSTGEEAYTLAMLVEEQLQRVRRGVAVRLFATDVRRDSLRFARAGQYPLVATAAIPEPLRNRYFEIKDDVAVARRPLRDMITFAHHDVMIDPPFTQLGLISCRNLLIYLTTDAQRRVLGRFRVALREGGYLLLGASETVGDAKEQFGVLESKHNAYVATGSSQAGLSMMRPPPRGDYVDEPAPARATPSRATEALLEAALRHFAPSGVAVDPDMELIQVFGRVSDYIEVPPGRVTTSLLRMVPQSVSVMLSSAARKVLGEGGEVAVPAVRVNTPRGEKLLTLRVVCVDDVPGVPRCLLVFFHEESSEVPPLRVEEGAVTGAMQQRLRELEDELVVAREGLQSAVQDQEATNEELQATNEELTASNEELQSTNEELQSVNEELYTVNSEYQQKISELEELNADLENLLRVVDAGVLFLDELLSIRRFNQSSTRLLPLRQEDLGRPLNEIAVQADYADLYADAQQVLDTGSPISRTVRADDGAWWTIGLRIFGTRGNPSGGVIVTMKEVSELKRAIADLSRVAQAQEIAENLSGSGYALIDWSGGMVVYSKGACRLFGLGPGPVRVSLPATERGDEHATFRQLLGGLSPEVKLPFTATRQTTLPDGSSKQVRITVQVASDAGRDTRLMFAFFQPVDAASAELETPARSKKEGSKKASRPRAPRA